MVYLPYNGTFCFWRSLDGGKAGGRRHGGGRERGLHSEREVDIGRKGWNRD